MKNLVYKLGMGVFIVTGYGIGQGYTSRPQPENFEGHLTENSHQQCVTHDKKLTIEEPSISVLKKRAMKQGDAQAQEKLKEMFFHLQLKSDAGDKEAQASLAFMYLKKCGVEKSISKAMELYEESAKQDYGPAQNKLGCLYVKKGDNESAVKWFRLAATQEHPISLRNLGYMYQGGHGVKQSNEEAAKLYEKAAAHGVASAQNDLGRMYALGQGVAHSSEKAAELYQLAVNQNYLPAIPNLARAYTQGWGVEPSFSKAFELFQQAANQGCAESKYNLFLIFRDRIGAEQSFKLLQEAANQGYYRAQYDFGSLCEKENKLIQASFWYQKAANQNYEPAKIKLKELEQSQKQEDPKKTAEKLIRQKNAEKSVEELAKEIRGSSKRKPRNKNKRNSENNQPKKRTNTPGKEAARTVTTSTVPLKTIKEEATNANEQIQRSRGPLKVKHSKNRRPHRHPGKMIGDLPLSSVKKELEKRNHKKQNPKIKELQGSAPLETSDRTLNKEDLSPSPINTQDAPEAPKKNEAPLDTFPEKISLELSSSEKENSLSPQNGSVNGSATPIAISINTPEKEADPFTSEKIEGVDGLHDYEELAGIRHILRQRDTLRDRNIWLNAQYGKLDGQYTLLYWKHIEALKYIEELEKKNADLQKQNEALSNSTGENSPREV